jgi:hypothetical protein
MTSAGDEAILDSRIRVPEHVVYREFSDETVVLNLASGMYHGLNETASRMLEVLQASDSVRAAVEALATEFAQPQERIEGDLVELCRALDERGLIERDGG